jgi:hypothetical protein
MNLILVGTLLVQAMSTFAEVNDMSEQQKKDMISYIGYMSLTGEAVEEALGWGKPLPRKRSN